MVTESSTESRRERTSSLNPSITAILSIITTTDNATPVTAMATEGDVRRLSSPRHCIRRARNIAIPFFFTGLLILFYVALFEFVDERDPFAGYRFGGAGSEVDANHGC